MKEKYDQELPLGYVDIALYRDDGFGPSDFPKVGVTDIPFRPKEHTIVLVDDVLFTGRTVRSALGAIWTMADLARFAWRLWLTVGFASYPFKPIG